MVMMLKERLSFELQPVIFQPLIGQPPSRSANPKRSQNPGKVRASRWAYCFRSLTF